MNYLATEKRTPIIAALVEGCSINSIVRMTGVSKVTILRLLKEVGRACLTFEDERLRDLPCTQIQADEIWGFCGAKDKNVRPENRDKPGHGSVWTWYAIDAESKLIVSWIMGDRDAGHAHAFMEDLASRLMSKPQLSTDGLGVYREAVETAFALLGVNYAQIHKNYRTSRDDEARYSPDASIGCEKRYIIGNSDPRKVSTSHIERANLTLRMSQRCWTRLTNAHSKKYENIEAAFALHSMWYNWCRKHATLGMSPAVATGLAGRVWGIEDIVRLVEDAERKAIEGGALKRGPYQKRN